LTIVTGNEQDFRRPGLKVFNPFKDLPAPSPIEKCRNAAILARQVGPTSYRR
jgi:hypothetical protein